MFHIFTLHATKPQHLIIFDFTLIKFKIIKSRLFFYEELLKDLQVNYVVEKNPKEKISLRDLDVYETITL